MTESFEVYELVRVATQQFVDEGVPMGALGYIIERYPDGALEVEFSDPATGETTATIVARETDLQHAD